MVGTPLRLSAAESVATSLLAQAMLVVSGILLARLLGVERRGYFALLVLFPALLTQLAALGLPQGVTHFAARHPGHTRAIVAAVRLAFGLQLLVATSAHLVTVLLYTRGKPPQFTQAGLATLVVGAGILAQQYGAALLLGLGRYRAFNLLKNLPALAHLLVVVLAFATGQSDLVPLCAAWSAGLALAGVTTLGVALSAVGRTEPETTSGAPPPRLAELVAFGARGMIGYVSPLDSFRLDQLIAGIWLSPAALGLYVVGQAFTNLPKFLAQGIGMILFPALSARGGSKGRSIARATAAVAVLNGIVVVPLILFAPQLVRLFFGDAFVPAHSIARILLVGAYVFSVRRILVEGLRGAGRPEISTYAELTLYAALALAPLLISRYGIDGLAVSVACGHAVALATAVLLALRSVRRPA